MGFMYIVKNCSAWQLFVPACRACIRALLVSQCNASAIIRFNSKPRL